MFALPLICQWFIILLQLSASRLTEVTPFANERRELVVRM